MATVRNLSPEARTILYMMVFNNERSCWLMNNLAGAHELRVEGFFTLEESFNGALKYQLDYDVSRILQKNFSFLHRHMPDPALSSAVTLSAKRASEAIQDRWMAF